MSTKSALTVLQRIEEQIDSERTTTAQRGLGRDWERDKRFVAAARACIASGEADCLTRLLNEMGPASHGFGGYSRNPGKVARLMEALYLELQELILATR